MGIQSVSGMQINDNACLTVKENDNVIASGIFKVEHRGRQCVFDIEGQRVTCLVEHRDSNPATVGCYPGQKRFFFSGKVRAVADIPGWKPVVVPPCERCQRTGGKITSASDVRHMIGHGFWLRVPHDGGQAELRRRYPDPSHQHTSDDAVPVPRAFLPFLLGSEAGYQYHHGQLGKLNELGYPPLGQRTASMGWKSGWRELGLDGDIADWYCFVQ
jgi:hypothetical protein